MDNLGGLMAYEVSIHDGMAATWPHPLTRKRFEILWTRLKRNLPWLDEIHGRPHDLRKTSAFFVERAFGLTVAQGWLLHTVGDVTDIHTMTGSEAVEDTSPWAVGRGRKVTKVPVVQL